MNLAKRRELIKSKSVSNLKSVMPDCVMPYVIHLLAYMPFYVKYDDVSQLEIVKGLYNTTVFYLFFKMLFSMVWRMSLVYNGTACPEERTLLLLFL